MCVLIHGLPPPFTELNDRWGEVIQTCEGCSACLVKVFDPDLGFGEGDWSTETVRLKAENLKESLIGPTNHMGMPCGASDPREVPSNLGFCDEKLVASQILHGDEDMLSWQDIKDGWGSCYGFARGHGIDPTDFDTHDELQEISTKLKAITNQRIG